MIDECSLGLLSFIYIHIGLCMLMLSLFSELDFVSTFECANVFLTSPGLEKTHSLATDVAGTHNIVCATELRIG